ncbi:MAG TPA: S9 family peptidase [Gemmatimonadetes bacterium]|nr:S9 family peptidase [Gemmatimonadota bacterium]
MTMRFSSALLALLASAPLVAQDATRQVTADDYTRAERFLSQNTNSLVFGASVSAQWLGDGRFWYRSMVPGGTEFVMVDPSEGTRERAFDHERIANVLNAVSGEAFESLSLPLNGLSLEGNDLEATVGPPGHFRCNLTEYSCESVAVTPGPTVSRLEVVSPDARNAVFIRDHNLWVRDLGTGDESALTTDGVEDFGYGTNNAGWTRSDRPILKWSPDSRKIATFRHDARGVGMMYLVNTQVGHPQLDAWRYPLPEDSVIFRISRVVLNLDRPAEDQIVSLAMPPDQHRSTCSDHIACGGSFGDVEWSLDSEHIVFVSSARDHKTATVRIANTSTGAVTVLFEEVEETFYESNGWDFLSSSNEILWFSQRDDWGHLYLYDAGTGALKRQVTQGDWNVLRIMEIDEGARTVTFIGNEREPGDPYFQYLYRTGLDGGDVELLTPDSANHTVSLSPDGKYLVDTYSTPVIPPVTVLRDREDGSRILAIEEADISRLQASGWQPPMPFSVKARDGETDLYGLLFRPMNFDPGRSYPIVNYLYPGPQSGSVGSRSFRASHRDPRVP